MSLIVRPELVTIRNLDGDGNLLKEEKRLSSVTRTPRGSLVTASIVIKKGYRQWTRLYEKKICSGAIIDRIRQKEDE